MKMCIKIMVQQQLLILLMYSSIRNFRFTILCY